MAHNPNCDGSHCKYEHGTTRTYPIGGGGNLILCFACWANENRYNCERGKEMGEPSNSPQHNWFNAIIYHYGVAV